MQEVSGHTIDLRDLLGGAGRRLGEQLRDTPSRRQLARAVGRSHKHLAHRFRQRVGLSPKTAARLVRFHQVWRRLDQRPAAPGPGRPRGGYADQAHLVRDFREFTGTTPTDFVLRTAARR